MGCQGRRPSLICSGNAPGSPASLKASWVTSPAAMCWPWPSRGVPWKREISTKRAVHADRPHHVAQHVLLPPLVEGLVQALREAVVDHGGEVLVVDAVVAVGDEQLLGADEAQPVEQLGADRVVARLAAVQGQQGETRALATAQPREHAAVLVVGMGGRVHGAGGGTELQQLLVGPGGASSGALRPPAPAAASASSARSDAPPAPVARILVRGGVGHGIDPLLSARRGRGRERRADGERLVQLQRLPRELVLERAAPARSLRGSPLRARIRSGATGSLATWG